MYVIEKNNINLHKINNNNNEINYDEILKYINRDKQKFEKENNISITYGAFLRDVKGININKLFDIELYNFYQYYLYFRNKEDNPSIEYILFHNTLEELRNGIGNII